MRIYQIEIEHTKGGERWSLFTYFVAASTAAIALKKAYTRADKDSLDDEGDLNLISMVWLNRVTYIA
jgi:hypothetical protein